MASPSQGGAVQPAADYAWTGTQDFTGATVLGLTPGDLSLASAHLFVGSAGGIATDRAITGDVTISNTGVTAIKATVSLTTPNINVATGTSLAVTGALSSSSPTAGNGYATGAGGAVTQITSNVTAVTLNKICGQVTTVALTLAALASFQFTVNNTSMTATSAVALGTTYAGAGTPMLSVSKVTGTSFDIVVVNAHASAALNAVMVINFAIIPAVAA